MSIFTRAARISPRLFATGLFIAIISTIVLASGWAGVNAFLELGTGLSNRQNETVPNRPEPAGTERGAALPPLTGTYNIPGDYPDLAAAIADLDAQGVGGAVTLNVLPGNPQTAPANPGTTGGGYIVGGAGSPLLTTTGPTSPVTIQGNGNTVTAPAAHVAGQLNDGIFKIVGADWITVTGFTMEENAANTTTTAGTNNMTEWGVALLYATATDGAQNNTIAGNTIDLNRTYQNTFGIYANATHTATAPTTSASATGPAGGSSGLTIAANNITDVNIGILVVGPTAAADHNDGLTIGGTALNANTLTNFGTTGTFSAFANVSGTVNGILVRNTKNFNISFNSVTSASGAAGVTAGTLRGIFVPAASTQPTGTFTNTINNNTLAISSHVLAGTVNAISVEATTSSPTSTTNINNNNVTTLNHTIAAASGAITAISQLGSATSGPLNHSISNNTFTNLTTNTTGSFIFISNNWTRPANAVGNVNNNSIATGFNKTGAGGTVTFYTSNSTSPSTVAEINTGNNFSNLTITGATTLAGWASTDGPAAGGPNKTVTNNTFQNYTGGTGAITALNVAFSSSSNVSNNLISNITSAGAITGITSSSGTDTFTQNTIHTLIGIGTGVVSGITNTGGTTRTFARNKIYNLENTSAGTGNLVNGILVSTAATATHIFNNLIGDLRAPSASSADAVRGFSSTSTTSSTALNVSFNTIYLNASSTGANFGTAGIFHTTSATAATSTLNLRNNIVVNLSTAAGTGVTAAYRRSSTELGNYGAVSNTNDFYAGTPGPANLIFFDGTNSDQTIATYKTRVGARDSASLSENPAFLTTTGANASFLHISSVTPTQLESGGTAIASIADDFDGETRNASTPDIGADEFAGIGIDLAPPAISYTPLANTVSTSNRTLTANIGDASDVAAGANLPRIYFRKSTDASYVSTQCALVSGTPQSGVYDCAIDYALVGGGTIASGDVVQYFVAAQDTIGNFGTNPAGGTGSVNNVTFGGTPNSYTIVPSIGGGKTVGVGGDYETLTAAIAAVNNAEIAAPVTLTLTDATYSSPAETFPLTLNANGGSSAVNTVTIKPAAGVTPTVSGSSASCLINLNGADYVTIDGSNAAGGTSRDLTLTNTSAGTSSAVVCLTSTGTGLGATNNVVKNTNIGGATTTAVPATLFGVFSGGSAIGITSAGADNDNNTVQNNNITKTTYGIYSGGASAANKNSGTVVTQNLMNAGSPNNVTTGGVLMNFENGAQITQNDIAVLKHDGTVGTTNTAFGIALGLVPNNTVTTFTGSDVTNAVVSRNRIGGVTQLNSTGYSAFGIVVNSVTSGTTLIANNMISGIRSAATASDFSGGIIAGGGTGSTTRIYFNSVALTGTRGAATFPSYGLAIGGGNPTVDIKNNVFYNTQTSSSTAKMYAIGTASTTFTNMTSDYNDFFVSGASGFVGQTGGLGTSGTDRVDLAAWNTATNQDSPATSESVDPQFVSNTDLHLQATSPLESQGSALAAVTVDFDGETRPATPDIGADEITLAQAGTVQFSAATYSVGEGGPTVAVTVTRTGGSAGAATVNYSLGGGTATGGGACGAGVDYVNAGGSVSFADGDTADKTFTVAVCDDGLFESSETFDATLSIASGAATVGTPNPATVTITDNDGAPTLQFSSATYSNSDDVTKFGPAAEEFAPTATTITVTRTGAIDNAVSVNFATANGTAVGGASCAAGIDYVSTSGTLNFAAGEISQTFAVTVCTDTLFEGSETVNLALSNPTAPAGLGTPNTAVLTIVDNDPQPSVNFSAANYTEDESQTASIGIVRSGDLSVTSTVNFATANGTAIGGASCAAGTDYVSSNGTVTFNPGDTLQTVTVQLCGDNLNEVSETVNLTLSNPSTPTGLGSPSTAVLTINNTASQYRNLTNIDVSGPNGSPYPAPITVAGGPTTISTIKVTLFDVNHNQADALDILLVGPAGQKMILMADAGGANGLATPATITFDDLAGQVLPDSGVIATGRYEPTSWEAGQPNFAAPAPAGPYSEPGSTVGGAVTFGSVFGGSDSNGVWSLYTRNDSGALVPVGGNVIGGWGLQIIAPSAANAELGGRLTTAGGEGIRNVTVMLSGGPLTQPRYVQTGTFGYYKFSDLPVGQTYLITVIPRRYTFAETNRLVDLTDSVLDADFVANPR